MSGGKIVILILLSMICLGESIYSGVYVDSGTRMDLEYRLSEEEIRALKEKLADLLGFPKNLSRFDMNNVDFRYL
jgi:hypothetical protein